MSKIGIYTDVHYCSESSIIRSRGEKYSTRIENCINSVNWAEDVFRQYKCDKVICLGDFFDKNTLRAEEIRGLNDIKFYSDAKHYFLVGNHEITRSDCTTSSMHLFNSYPFIEVVDRPKHFVEDGVQLCFIPYTIEEERKSIYDLFGTNSIVKRVVFSHNDVKGVRFGAFVSEEGLDINDIKNNCNLFINGHLHNGGFLDKEESVLNLGNLTGQNFGEDAFKYNHLICILDTDTLDMDFFENPYAFNFVKLDLVDADIDKINKISMDLPNNCVATIRCDENSAQYIKYRFSNSRYIDEEMKSCGCPKCSKIIDSRIIIDSSVGSSEFNIDQSSKLSIDHLKLFKDFVLDKVGTSKEVTDELSHILEVEG